MKIYEKLKSALKDKEITLEELGEKTNTSKVRIHNYLNGKTKLDIDIFLKICESLDLNPSQIIEENPENTCSSSERIKSLQDKINELEEELHHLQQMLAEIKSEDLMALFYSRMKRYLESVYYLQFQNNSIDSVIRELPEDDDEYEKQYRAGLKVYNKIKSLAIDPEAIRTVVELFEFDAHEKISDNRFMRNQLRKMLEKDTQHDRFGLVLFNDAKRRGNKFTQKMIEIHKEEFNDFLKACNSDKKDN